MNIKTLFILIGCILLPLNVSAETFRVEVHVEADDQGRIIVQHGEGITALTQYCPDEWVDGCPNNISIKRNGDIFELDRAGLSEHQTVFNFRNKNGGWLLIPDRQLVTVGKNVDIKKGAEGSYFIYTGP